MKSSFVLTIIALFLFTTVSAQKKETVKVWGNCGMCQKTIETAAKSAGATEAEWNTETKMLTVSYKGKKTNLTKIEQAVAAVGYDTQNFTAPDEVYNKLHGCCQYDRKSESSAKAHGDCCKDGSKCEKGGDHAKCADCEKCKDGKCADCCKDGVCSTGKDCCKKA
jgi:periplasmic mercuric ion binding protein